MNFTKNYTLFFNYYKLCLIDASKMTAAGVHHWLSSLNLPKEYEALLLEGGYDTLAKCQQLNDAVLEQIGISLVGHRRRILSHLPCNVNELSTPAQYDSDDDDREIYDIPPVPRQPAVVLRQDSTYANIAEMNEIPKPVLPPKKRLSSVEEVDAKLGIVSPPFKPRLAQGIFGISSRSTDSVRTTLKLCVVHPEKRPPVPARRVSKDQEVSSMDRLNNNDEGSEVGLLQEATTAAAVAPVAVSHTFLKHQDAVSEDDSKTDAVPLPVRKLSEPSVTAVDNISPVLRAESVDSAPKLSSSFDAGSADAVLGGNKLNHGLELELEEFVSSVKKCVLGKVDSDAHAASDSCGTSVSAHSEVVQSANSIPEFAVSFNSDSCDGSVAAEESPISTSKLVESDNLYSLETSSEQTTGSDCHEKVNVKTADLECVYVGTVSDEDRIAERLSLYQNQGLTANDLGILPLKEKAEPEDELHYEVVNETASCEQDTDQRESTEFHYSPPAFPPPPLPTDFSLYGVLEFSTHLESSADNREQPSRTSRSSILGFANFAEERAKETNSVRPVPPPRRRECTADVVNDVALSPLAAGFSDALEDYLTQKVASSADWLNKPVEYLSLIKDSQFGSYADRPPEGQSSVQFVSDRDCLIKAAGKDVLCGFGDAAEVAGDGSVNKKTKSCHDNPPDVVRPLSTDDFKEVACSKQAGNLIKTHVLCYSVYLVLLYPVQSLQKVVCLWITSNLAVINRLCST